MDVLEICNTRPRCPSVLPREPRKVELKTRKHLACRFAATRYEVAFRLSRWTLIDVDADRRRAAGKSALTTTINQEKHAMKRIALYLTLSLALGVASPGKDILAKPLYCGDALTRCLDACDHGFTLFRYGCSAGCGIGYLACGS